MGERSIRKQSVGFNEPLHNMDTEEQTYGCRANNPDICGNAFLEDVCAFMREDNICKRPSRQWKKQYEKLANEKAFES